MKKRLATIYSGVFGLVAIIFILSGFGSTEAQAEGIWYTKLFTDLCENQCPEYQPYFCDCTLHDTIIVE